MPDLWMPGASRLDVGDHAPTDGGPAKAVAHITWDRNASAAAPSDLVPYESLRTYFSGGGSGAAPHILWDPFTGRVTQFFPADSRSKSVVDSAGGTRTNRAGSVVIQVETLFFPYCRTGGKVYPRLVDTPCKGWAELNAWVRSWGVPDTWPMGRPTDFSSNRSESVWETRAGWYAHAQVPENDHQDPGSWPAFTSEDDMPLSDDDKQAVANAIWDGYSIDDPTKSGTQYTPIKSVLWWAAANAASAANAVAAIDKKVSALAATVASLQTTGLTPEQVTAIANAVADVQAKRLES